MKLQIELIVRVLLVVIYGITDDMTPFFREIQDEEWWLYRNPRRESYVPVLMLWSIVLGVPAVIILISYYLKKDRSDAISAFLGVSFSLFLSISIINIVKLIVGRPRPDFYYRCWPEGRKSDSDECTGSVDVISEGRKSFPSGHSGMSFSSLGFVTLYLIGKLHVFTTHGRGEAWRLLVAFTPAFGALVIALSRTADYHHHWQDVLVGSIIGIIIAYTSYRQYYPCLTKGHCHRPLAEVTPHEPKSPPHLDKGDQMYNV